MPYKKNGRYTWKGRRYRKHLSTRNIFANKGSKAQAKQINSLRKSINKVAKMCKPEVKVRRSALINDKIGLNNIYPGETIVNFKQYGAPFPTSGTGDDQCIGNLIRLYPMKINFSSQYKKIINSVSTPIATKLFGTSGGVRMIVLQSKSALANAPNLTDILQNTPTSIDDSVGILNSPFTNGITARFNILYNKVFYYSENQLIKCKNLSIKPVIRQARWEEGYSFPIGFIWVFLVAGGFSFVDVGSGDTPYDYDVCDYSIKFEIPYSDA